MKKKSTFTVLLMLVLVIMLAAQTAFTTELPGITVPVRVSLTGTHPETPESFVIKLSADHPSYSMPAGAENGVYAMTVTGESTKNFPAIYYDTAGIYTYTISQEPGSNSKCTYDKTVYELTVYVTNAENSSKLEVAAVLHPDAQGDKLPEAEFVNEYETESGPVPSVPERPGDGPETGDNSNLLLYLVLSGISVSVLAALPFIRRKQKLPE